MLGKFFECEANKNDKYYRVIQTIKAVSYTHLDVYKRQL